jgi:hypothetical protein
MEENNEDKVQEEGPSTKRGRQRSISLVLPPSSASETRALLADVGY